MRNPYEVLGIQQDATEDEIRKSYRKLSKLYHEDRNPGDDEALRKYREVQEAYDNIVNPKGHQTFNPSDMFGDMFSQVFNQGFNFGQPQRNINPDIQFHINLDFWEASLGCEKTITIPRATECVSCGGSGAEEHAVCSNCHGTGKFVQRQSNFSIQTPCNNCNGSGKKIIKNCKKCKSGIIYEDVKIFVNFPEGTLSGMAVLVHGQGNVVNKRQGNLFVITQVNPHSVFVRQQDHLCYRMPVQYSVLVKGGKIKVPTLDEEVEIEIPPLTKSGTEITVNNKGFRNPSNNRYGNLLVGVVADTVDPSEAGKEYKKLIENLYQWEKDNITPNMKKFNESCKQV